MSLQSSTQFRRSGQPNDRRRRLLADDISGSRTRGALRRECDCAMAQGRSRNYGDATFMDEQLRLTDLIPRRLTTFMLLFLGGVACVLGLEALYSWMPEFASISNDGRVAAFDLDGEGSLAVWFSSVVLLFAGLAALIVYYVRRHKTDDYQGRYRIWLAAAACWMLMGIDETSSLHEGFKEMMTHITGTRLLGDGSLWWAIPYFFILGILGSRLMVDMRKCILSSAALAATAVCYIVAVAAQLQWIMPKMGAKGVMLEEGAEMIGNLFLLMAMGLHARYVILDAEGLLPHTQVEEPEEQDEYDEEEQEEAADEWIKVDSPHKAPQPVLKRKEKKRAKKRSSTAAAEAEEEAAIADQALSKREKKAMRKRLIRNRTERERGQHKAWK